MPTDVPPGARWLREHWLELRKINFQWVAARKGELIAHHPELDEVMSEVIRRELTEDAVYAFVDFTERLEE